MPSPCTLVALWLGILSHPVTTELHLAMASILAEQCSSGFAGAAAIRPEKLRETPGIWCPLAAGEEWGAEPWHTHRMVTLSGPLARPLPLGVAVQQLVPLSSAPSPAAQQAHGSSSLCCRQPGQDRRGDAAVWRTGAELRPGRVGGFEVRRLEMSTVKLYAPERRGATRGGAGRQPRYPPMVECVLPGRGAASRAGAAGKR